MTSFKLIIRNLLHYWQRNLLLAFGISISAAVLTGALIVGDSVDYSLKKIVSDRLGEISHVVKSGDRYFTTELAEKVSSDLGFPTAPVLMSEGIAVAGGGQERINNTVIVGVDDNFDPMAGTENYYSRLSGDQVILSENSAQKLGIDIGDEILLRIRKASLIPLNAPFVSDRENTVTARLEIIDIAGRESLGTFNLKNSQTAPFNAFISLERLNEMMELENRSNLMLIKSDTEIKTSESLNAISKNWNTEDASLNLEKLEVRNEIEISSERVFIDAQIADLIKETEGFKYPVVTYFVNGISTNSASTPYSFVSTLPEEMLTENEVIINKWLADDLNVEEGDSLKMKYFIVGPLRELKEEESVFIIKSIVEMEGRFADRNLMPHLPGLSDAGNCRDWEAGIPIDLEKIRDKDEDYWDEWKGTPKAFISLPTAVKLWQNRFGSYTAFRFDAKETSIEKIESNLQEKLSPSRLGFEAKNVKSQAEKAAEEGVDFSQLFAGLSFFLLVAGVLLAVLLFLLNLEFRKEQVLTLSAMGIPHKKIRYINLVEGLIIAIPGALFGLLLAILYNKAVFSALNGIWHDIVRTEMLAVHINPLTLLEGFLASVVISAAAIYLPLNKFLKKNLKKIKTDRITSGTDKNKRIYSILFLVTGIIAIALIAWEIFKGEIQNASIFFLAGGLLLIAGISFFRFSLFRLSERSYELFHSAQLSLKNALRNTGRSMTVVILFTVATFLVISTGSNRKDLFINAEDPSSGTGGFLFYAESSVPVLQSLNQSEKRFEYGLSEAYDILQFRKAEGDDASCLNLNRIQNPEIISINPDKLEGRFSFQTRTDYLDEELPWSTLEKDLPGNLIPAIADETVIKWGLGKKVGDTLHYTNSMGEPMKLLLVGGLAPSIFQGKVIISNTYFLESFPESSGTSVFLIGGEPGDSAMIYNEINRGLRDYGIEIELSAARLAEFNSVTNTYLSIFLVMGALGLLLGTIGLGIVLFRSVLERKNEIALMKAVGFNKKFIRRIISREYNFLLISGIGIGFVTAVIATLPSILSPNTGISFPTLMILLLVLFLSGWFWTFLMTSLALRNKRIYEALRNE